MKCPFSTKLFLVAGKCSTVPGQTDERNNSGCSKSIGYIQVIRKKLEVPLMNNLLA